MNSSAQENVLFQETMTFLKHKNKWFTVRLKLTTHKISDSNYYLLSSFLAA